MQEVHENQRGDAANSLVYEANLRLRDPVYGCMGAILTLQQQVQALEAELAAVRAEIVKHRYRPAAPAATVLPSSHASQLLAASTTGGAGGRGAFPIAGTLGVTMAMATLPAATAASSSSSAAYAAASSSTDYSSITNENAPFFS
ncbi:hypothetical protein GUJ93_ZPchr0010g7818 [Zizania palustris]|uniref:LOB domain-containing protein n=1 Tax=Zizania palustris TaxID=103762 RepID=A0A8J6BLP7_ZIZPA|nr:hypothetical protein GUJ93_ZPchr0010g7413 [Zizania palustris]KAG8084898.1 hypothetical protein GUJ93_ZPchr0010g7818 [Zizania palustris]